MILGYKQTFPFNREQTNFHKKIIVARYPNCIYVNEGWAPKVHSIRKDLFNRWKPGMLIQHAYGVRTKNYDCFDECQCVSTQEIEIKEIDYKIEPIIKEALTLLEVPTICHYVFEEYAPKLDIVLRKRFRVSVDKRVLSLEEINTLAKNDGFDSTHDFFRWFNQDFKGKIIHWTYLKY